MPGAGRVAIGSLLGAVVAAISAPLIRPFFGVPSGGVGWVTVNQYPKGWDYAVVALFVACSLAGGVLAGPRAESREPRAPSGSRQPAAWVLALVVFLFMLFGHDQPYSLVDMFHDGEHLVPAFVLRDGGRPFADIFHLHGLATDGGLDALFMGDPPSLLRSRRMYTLLTAATVALLVPIAVEVCATAVGMTVAVLLTLAAMGAGQAMAFPYFRLAPLLLATYAWLRYARTKRARWLFAAFASSTMGLLWSLDTGAYSVAGSAGLAVAGLIAARRWPSLREVAVVVAAIALPFVVLLAVRADIGQFLHDSFVLLPGVTDAAGSLPAPGIWTSQAPRYYGPLVMYGFLLALAFRLPPPVRWQIVIVVAFSLLLYRTAAGRAGWSHVRYAMPLAGIAATAWIIEPLMIRRRAALAVAAALPFLIVFEVGPNVMYGARAVATWRERQGHDGLVRYPVPGGRGIYTFPRNANDLAMLDAYLRSFGPEARFLDFSGERALYYFLQRRPPVRIPDLNVLSNRAALREAMAQLEAGPPDFVVVAGEPVLRQVDGVTNEQRVPELARWIDEHYPRRFNIGRFVIAAPTLRERMKDEG
ncbi:MAG TPA: hypothetical protein VM779_08065 [Thermoanaerobaculia bacterium]|nr:hypothetical protein [Thermoanaerobaculia bacterium]